MRAVVFCLVLAVCIQSAFCSEAQLVVSKRVLTDEIILGEDIPVNIRIFNVGQGTAYDVTLRDEAWDPKLFSYEVGLPAASWERIAPGANISHTFVVKAKDVGVARDQSAIISYRAQVGGALAYVRSSSYNYLGVQRHSERESRSSSHFTEWVIFSAGALALLFIPYWRWSNLKRNYPNGVPKGSALDHEINKRRGGKKHE